MIRPLSTIQNVQKELDALAENNSLAQAKRVVLSVVKLLDGNVTAEDANLIELFNVDNQKISANAGWFCQDEVVVDRRAIYKVHAQNALNLDFKLFCLTKPSKRTISWVQALTPNFEDEPFNTKFNVGIDFVIPKSFDKVIVVLSNNYVIRTLELKGTLTATFQEIFGKWAGISDFTNKREIHNILWDSFDLQPLNKKFYAGISERFITLRQHLTKENILDETHASLFANRLLGRVIFCWFLDKKGIINPDRKYFDVSAFSSDSEYYKASLENLFFGVLNTPITEREYRDVVTPFLNGGLFEARESDLPKNSKLTFPKNFFGDLFEFLSGYNFTTDESTSQFQQVAIDPEMLGRIFENLLAEMTEEGGGQARKSKGAFYTPREVVDYMCRETLREYLRTKLPVDEHRDQRLEQLIDRPDKEFQDQDHNWRRDWKPYKEAIIKALDELKVLDPACGSGAFPIGMLQLLVKVYERLEARFDPYKTKLQIIEKNIYGVDIEPMAVEIARLRTWLSIIVDEESDSKKIKPLPNLEFKFICANALIDLDKNGNGAIGEDPDFEEKLRSVRDAYFNTESLAKKKRLKAEYEQLVGIGEGLFGESEKSKQLKTYRPFDNETSAVFFSADFMFGVKSFDIVIGNPPYVSYGLRGGQKMTSEDKKLTRLLFPNSAEYKISLYALFMDRAIQLADENGGIQSFIVPDSFLLGRYFSKIRKYILSTNEIERILLFSYGVFSATVGFSVVYVFKRVPVRDPSHLISAVFPKTPDDLIKRDAYKFEYEQTYFDKTKYNRFRLFYDNLSKNLIAKIDNNSIELGSIYIGRTGVRSKIGQKNIISKEKKSDTYQRAIISGGQITRYKIIYDNDFLNIDPAILNSGGWDYDVMHNPKILIRQTGDSLIASIDKDNFYHLNNVHSFAPKKDSLLPLEYILGVLNSKLMNYYYQITTLEVSRPMAQTDIETIESLPIRMPSEDKLHRVEELVNKILTTKSIDASRDSSQEINEIDKLVYEIYEINEVEQLMIESTVKM